MSIGSALILSIYILFGLIAFVVLTSPLFWKWVVFKLKNLARKRTSTEKAIAQLKEASEILRSQGFVVNYTITQHQAELQMGMPVRENHQPLRPVRDMQVA